MTPKNSSSHTLLRLLLLLCLPLSATAQNDNAAQRQAMNAAYRQYQEVIAQGPQFRQQAVEPARQAYELALEVLGDADPTTAALAINYGNVVRDGDEASTRSSVEDYRERQRARRPGTGRPAHGAG